LFAVSAFAMPVDEVIDDNEPWHEIDWDSVVPIEETPGFWDGREIAAVLYPGETSRNGRIVGGAVVTPGHHPYQAGLLMATRLGGTGLCGGSMINARTVLTAAHCPINTVSTTIHLGAHELRANEAAQQRRTAQASAYRLHASYNPSNLNNDIATIIMPTTVAQTNRIAHIALAPAGAGTFAGVTATVSGWGRISDASSATSATLRNVQNVIITNAVCAQTYGTSVVIGSVICMSTAGGRGTCNGDSGGPLTVPSGGARQQIGVVSFGAAAGCQAGMPAGFARVSSFRAWITANTQN